VSQATPFLGVRGNCHDRKQEPQVLGQRERKSRQGHSECVPKARTRRSVLDVEPEERNGWVRNRGGIRTAGRRQNASSEVPSCVISTKKSKNTNAGWSGRQLKWRKIRRPIKRMVHGLRQFQNGKSEEDPEWETSERRTTRDRRSKETDLGGETVLHCVRN